VSVYACRVQTITSDDGRVAVLQYMWLWLTILSAAAINFHQCQHINQ